MATVSTSIIGVGGIIFLVIMVVVIRLQIFLSKKKSMILGLIMPTLILGFYLVFLLSGYIMAVDLYGGEGFRGWLLSWLVLEAIDLLVPAVILLIIYFVSRRKMRRNRRLRKMVIEDWT